MSICLEGVHIDRIRACGRPITSTGSCVTKYYPTSHQYSRVHGRVIGLHSPLVTTIIVSQVILFPMIHYGMASSVKITTALDLLVYRFFSPMHGISVLQLPAPTTDMIEVSIYCDQGTNDEDTPINLLICTIVLVASEILGIFVIRIQQVHSNQSEFSL